MMELFLIQLITPSLNFINYVLLLIMGIILFFNWQISLSILFIVSFMSKRFFVCKKSEKERVKSNL